MATAVILSARRERDSDIPYSLQELEHGGTCLLSRVLGQLRERGYDTIFIVVGYCASLFERYADDDIHIVINEDYMFTSSMGSLARLEGMIHEDFLLVEGDTFYEGRVFDALKACSYTNCLAVTEESGSGDEAFVEVKEGFITKVSKDKHQIKAYAGELLGVMKINLRTYKAMLDMWHEADNPYLNYEYIFMDCTGVLDRPYVYFSDLIWGDVDDGEDLHRLRYHVIPKLYRRDNPFDRANLQSYIENICQHIGIEGYSDCELTPIGGMSNKNYKVGINDKNYVLRVPGVGSSGMIERSVEEQNGIKASSLNINPPTRYFDVSTGIKFVDFIDGAETLNSATIQRPVHIDQVASILSTLHNATVRFVNDFNVFLEIQRYENLIQCQIPYSDFEVYRPCIYDLEQRLDKLGVVLTPCHNDTVAENFVRDISGNLFLIDWEYSGMNDPMWDIAALFLESSFTEDNQVYFLRKYLGREATVMEREKIFIYKILIDWLWALWTIIKEEHGDNLGTYGCDRYSRSITMYNYWRKTQWI